MHNKGAVLLLLVLLSAVLCEAWKASFPHKLASFPRKLTSSFAAGAILLGPLTSFVAPAQAEQAEAALVTADARKTEASFADFVVALDAGKYSRVTFYGIRPTYLIAEEKESGRPVLVSQGFPAYDDPLSPSGPAQAIAKVQHTPGVICMQDISDALKLAKTSKISATKPMLSSSAFPREYAYTRAEDGTYVVNGNDPRRGQ